MELSPAEDPRHPPHRPCSPPRLRGFSSLPLLGFQRRSPHKTWVSCTPRAPNPTCWAQWRGQVRASGVSEGLGARGRDGGRSLQDTLQFAKLLRKPALIQPQTGRAGRPRSPVPRCERHGGLTKVGQRGPSSPHTCWPLGASLFSEGRAGVGDTGPFTSGSRVLRGLPARLGRLAPAATRVAVFNPCAAWNYYCWCCLP